MASYTVLKRVNPDVDGMIVDRVHIEGFTVDVIHRIERLTYLLVQTGNVKVMIDDVSRKMNDAPIVDPLSGKPIIAANETVTIDLRGICYTTIHDINGDLNYVRFEDGKDLEIDHSNGIGIDEQIDHALDGDPDLEVVRIEGIFKIDGYHVPVYITRDGTFHFPSSYARKHGEDLFRFIVNVVTSSLWGMENEATSIQARAMRLVRSPES